MRSKLGAGRLLADLIDLTSRPPDRRALNDAAERLARSVSAFAGLLSLVDPARPLLAGRRDPALVERVLERIGDPRHISRFDDSRTDLTVHMVRDGSLRADVDAARARRRSPRADGFVLGALLFTRRPAPPRALVAQLSGLFALWLGRHAAGLELTGRQRALELGRAVSSGLLEESGSALGLDRLLERMRGLVPCDALSVALPVDGALHAIHVVSVHAPPAFADAVARELAVAVGAARVRSSEVERAAGLAASAVAGVRPRRVGSSLVLELPDPGGGPSGYLAFCSARPGTLQPRHLRIAALVTPWLAGALAGAASVRAERAEARARREEITRARTVQTEMGPSAARMAGADIAFRASAVDGVSGDIHDVVRLSDGRIGIFIGDVCGHGVPAALVSSFIRGVLVDAWSAAGPADVLRRVHAALHARASLTSELMFVTACAALFSPADSTLAYAVAGHPAPVVKTRDGTHLTDREVFEGAPPLGAIEVAAWPEARLALASGDVAVFFTDGVAESFPGGLAGLVEREASAAQVVETIDRLVRPEPERADDRTVIALRVL